MPRVKKATSVKKTSTTSLRGRESSGLSSTKQSVKKIATLRQTQGKLPRNDKMSVPVYSLTGKSTTTLSLPKEFFGQKVNKNLLAQAVRVYTTNQKIFTGKTKTRGEVEGSTAKIYRQKGTGRARHGAIRAPIFVGGGIVFGPRTRKVRLNLPQRMKKVALISALSAKMIDKTVFGLSGLEKASGKTKEIVGMLRKIDSKKSSLIVIGDKQDNVVRAVKNISTSDVMPVSLINAYEILKHDLLLITKEAIEKLVKPQIKEQK